jgi:hypothetical protein
LTQNTRSTSERTSVAEATASTAASVVVGLGYPNGRVEISLYPVGWQAEQAEITTIEKQVSRETSR